MLQAKTKAGRHITLASLTKTEIARQRKQTFFCPMCNEQVIVRAGPQTVPHFAHKSRSDCSYREGGESSYHEKGKFLIYQWLKSQGLEVELEHYLPSIQQRPDVYLRVSNKRIAFEYQCSRIPIQTVNKRIRGYFQMGVTPIWILSAKLFKRHGNNRLKMDAFLRHFIHHFSVDTIPVLYFFCPNTKHLLHFQHIYVNRPHQSLGRIHVSPLNKTTLLDMFVRHPYSHAQLYRDWKYEKKFFRIHQKRNLYGKELAWYQWLYEKRINKEYLPSIIYVPVRGQHRMKTPLWDWQSRICLDIIAPLQMNAIVTYSECKQLLSYFIDKMTQYPLLKPRVNPIKEYLDFLEWEGTLQQVAPYRYKKVKQITFYTTLEKAIQGDQLFMDSLIKKAVDASIHINSLY